MAEATEIHPVRFPLTLIEEAVKQFTKSTVPDATGLMKIDPKVEFTLRTTDTNSILNKSNSGIHIFHTYHGLEEALLAIKANIDSPSHTLTVESLLFPDAEYKLILNWKPSTQLTRVTVNLPDDKTETLLRMFREAKTSINPEQSWTVTEEERTQADEAAHTLLTLTPTKPSTPDPNVDKDGRRWTPSTGGTTNKKKTKEIGSENEPDYGSIFNIIEYGLRWFN